MYYNENPLSNLLGLSRNRFLKLSVPKKKNLLYLLFRDGHV